MSEHTDPHEDLPKKPRSGGVWLQLASVLAIIGLFMLLLLPEVLNQGGRAAHLILTAGLFLLTSSIAAGIGLSQHWPWGR